MYRGHGQFQALVSAEWGGIVHPLQHRLKVGESARGGTRLVLYRRRRPEPLASCQCIWFIQLSLWVGDGETESTVRQRSLHAVPLKQTKISTHKSQEEGGDFFLLLSPTLQI